jgi:hypothetical protein
MKHNRMKTLKCFFVLAILICLNGCRSPEKHTLMTDSIGDTVNRSYIDSMSIRNWIDTVSHLDFQILNQFLGKEVSQIRNIHFTEGYVIVDTTFVDDDESVWPGLVIKKRNKQIIQIETSWMNTHQIARISILSDEIYTPDSITVGSKFGDIKERISPSIPSMPDGVFAVRSQKHPSVLLFLEPINQKMYFGNITFKEIPSTCKVSYIMLK